MAGSTTYEYILELKDRMTKTMNKVVGKSSKAYGRLQKFQGKLNSITKKFAPISNKVFAVVGVAAVGAFAKKIVSSTIKMAEMGDEASKTSRMMGMSAESLQEMRFAAERQGVATQTMNQSFLALNKRMGELRAGSGQLYSYLNKTGQSALSQQLMTAKDSQEAFMMLTKRMEEVKNPMDRAALANAAFSRSGISMLKMMEAGEEGMKKLYNTARETGTVMSNETAASAEDFMDVYTNLQHTIQGVKVAIATELMPIIQQFMKRLTGWIKRNRELIATKIKAFVTGLANAIKWLVSNMNWLVPALKAVVAIMVGLKIAMAAVNVVMWAMSANPIGLIIIGITAAVIGLIIGIRALIKNWDVVKATMLGVWEVIKSGFEILKIYMLAPIKLLIRLIVGLGKTLWYVMTGRFKKAIEEGKNTFKGLKDQVISDATKIKNKAVGIGKDFQRGFDKGMEGVKKKKTSKEKRSPLAGLLGGAAAGERMNDGMLGAAGMQDVGGEAATAITTGGKKQTNITLTLGNLVENMQISGSDFDEATSNMQDKVVEALLRALNSANAIDNG